MVELDEKTKRFGMLLARIRDSFQTCVEEIDSYLNDLGTPSAPTSFVKEETFNILKFEPAKGERLGEFEVAHKNHNLPDNWTHAFNTLKQNNATIASRYFGPDYTFTYWLYGEDRIYRQRKASKK